MTTNEASALDTATFRAALLDIDLDGADNDVPESVIRAASKARHTLDAIELDDRIPRGGMKAVELCAAYIG